MSSKTETTIYNLITMTEQLKQEVWGLLLDLNLAPQRNLISHFLIAG